MSNTLGFHVVKSGYGLWLPGDDRGSWSEAWDKQIGFHEPHTLHPGDPVRKRMAEERMKHPPVRFTDDMILAVVASLGECVDASKGDLKIAAASVVSTHMHLLLFYGSRDIDITVKWLSDQTTKSVHRRTTHTGPLWGKGKWRSYVFDEGHWQNTIQYIEQHNLRHYQPAKRYSFIV
jgi:hypothetical protein